MKKHTFADTARLVTTFAILFQQLVGGSLAFAQDGAVVVGGAATISQQGADLNVTTHTDRTVINWDSFNISAGHTAKPKGDVQFRIAFLKEMGADSST